MLGPAFDFTENLKISMRKARMPDKGCRCELDAVIWLCMRKYAESKKRLFGNAGLYIDNNRQLLI